MAVDWLGVALLGKDAEPLRASGNRRSPGAPANGPVRGHLAGRVTRAESGGTFAFPSPLARATTAVPLAPSRRGSAAVHADGGWGAGERESGIGEAQDRRFLPHLL